MISSQVKWYRKKAKDPAYLALRAEKARLARRRRGLRKAGRKMLPPIERFWTLALPEPNSGCWIWTGFLLPNGYGRFGGGGKYGPTLLAHRFSYEHFVGPIGDGYEVHHTCQTRCCVNPEHLRTVTHREHMAEHARCRS